MIESFYKELTKSFKGEIKNDEIYKKLYATDASAYREIPAMILIPKDKDDLITIVKAADKHKVNLIPRAAGTSLAGQVVGGGVVVYIGHNFSKILEINTDEKWVRIQPGVVLDELNKELAKHNLFFGPETSTSNRCMIGGMLGNNSCGAHSLIYGSVRDHILEVEAILADGSVVVFKDLDKDEFQEKLKLASLEGKIYRKINEILSNKEIVDEIKQQYPHPDIKRRNTGYALDILLDTCIFSESSNKFNLSKLIAGSEGTLAVVTELKLNLVDTPPKHKALMCVHVNELKEVFYANLIALKHKPVSIELMDKKIMDLTKENINQNRNRFFVDGDPAAILIVEWFANDPAEIDILAENLKNELIANGIGYAYPVIKGKDISRVWELRK
ncbi:MAG: FAD-binding oxidoreductase, partial [Bacteroidales bacterium]